MGTFLQETKCAITLSVTWWYLFPPFIIFEARLLYEEIWLTWTKGQQMIGFSLAHLYPALLIIGIISFIGCILWSIASTLLLVLRKNSLSQTGKIQFKVTIGTLILSFLPLDTIILMLRRF